MKFKSQLIIGLLFNLISFGAAAQFDYPGKAQITFAEGQTQTVEFGFSYLMGTEGAVFKLGQHQMQVDEVPKRFTLAIVLNEKNQVWVTDFSDKPLTGFRWQLGTHQIELLQEAEQKPQRLGDYTLLVDGARYHFTERKRGLIHFNFKNSGIESIQVEAMLMPRR